MSDQKNMIMAAVLSFLVIIAWQMFFAPTPPEPLPEIAESIDDPSLPQPEGAHEIPVGRALDREEALALSTRIPVETPNLVGTISLRGGRIDDLTLTRHRETVDPDSPPVTLFSPTRTAHPYYAVWGWVPAQGSQTGPTPATDTPWDIETGDVLTPDTPVTLMWDNGEGLIFRQTVSVDADFLFTIEQSVENTTDETLTLAPWGIVARHGEPAELIGFWILHEGAIASIDGRLNLQTYSNLRDLERDPLEGAPADRMAAENNGWLGFTDKYWLAALAGGADQPFTGVFKTVATSAGNIYQSDIRMPPVSVAAGETASAQTMLFAGAKDVSVLRRYERERGIENLDYAVDWGWFFFLTRPIFSLLMVIHGVIGNMGWSIILLTVAIKTLLFPLAYKSFVSMSKMKQLQPEMEKLKERCGDDKQKLQQEMIALYRERKVNPASGCLPILIQIPIFFSLYKVFFVTLELRHAPFFGWIVDLSEPDPTSILNLFGLLPWSVAGLPGFLQLFSIGVFPVLMGITMWMQQKLNPAPTDPTQAQIFAIMPFMFMFLLGSFASGLVLYWIANNVITFAQQYSIMR